MDPSPSQSPPPEPDRSESDPERPERYELTCTVDAYRSGWTLRNFLAHRFRYHPPEIWSDRIAGGFVRRNGEVIGEDAIVARGDRIEYSFLHAEPPVDFRFHVVHEDHDLLVVSKSGNLPVHAGGKFIRNTLIARLRGRWGSELRLAHRLDRETSGLVILAKTKDVARALEREFRERRVQKLYLAIVRGEVPPEMAVDAPIARREPAAPPYFRVVSEREGKPARTEFRRLAVGRGRTVAEPLSCVAAVPREGRTNQIRVHAHHRGHPLLGDKIYGVPEALAREFVERGETGEVLRAAGAPRHLLHCGGIAIGHPRTGSEIRLRAPLPGDFRESWEGDLPEDVDRVPNP